MEQNRARRQPALARRYVPTNPVHCLTPFTPRFMKPCPGMNLQPLKPLQVSEDPKSPLQIVSEPHLTDSQTATDPDGVKWKRGGV